MEPLKLPLVTWVPQIFCRSNRKLTNMFKDGVRICVSVVATTESNPLSSAQRPLNHIIERTEEALLKTKNKIITVLATFLVSSEIRIAASLCPFPTSVSWL